MNKKQKTNNFPVISSTFLSLHTWIIIDIISPKSKFHILLIFGVKRKWQHLYQIMKKVSVYLFNY